MRDEDLSVKHFTPSQDPAEGLGVLMLFRLIEESLPAFFQEGRPIKIVRAPGRLDIMGGLCGEKAALSITLPTAEAACAAIQGRDDDLVRLWSPCRDGSRSQMLSVRLQDLGLPQEPLDYEQARAFLLADPSDRWAGYVLGSLLVLAREHALTPVNGAELLLHSDVPNSCGVASSSAVTVASLRAFALQYGLDLSPSEVARLAKIVEQQVLQVDGRATDAMASVLAESGELLVLSGSAGDLLARIPVPSDLEFVGIDTGTKSDGQTQGHWPEGEEERIQRFQDLFGMEASDGHRQELGDLMFRAHEDYASHGLSNEACDLVVAAAMRRREAGGDIFGAKLTGRGGGGTVVLLGRYGKVWYEALRVKKALNEATGHSGHIFRWSSPGAESFGSIELMPKQE